MRRAVIPQILKMVVRIPGRARVLALGVAGPERDPKPPGQLVLSLCHQPGAFDHGGVGAAVVHCAVIPGIDVPGEENVLVALRAFQVRDQKRAFSPFIYHRGLHSHLHMALF